MEGGWLGMDDGGDGASRGAKRAMAVAAVVGAVAVIGVGYVLPEGLAPWWWGIVGWFFWAGLVLGVGWLVEWRARARPAGRG